MTETIAHPDPVPGAGIPAAERLPRPRIRTGAVVWGLVLIAAAASALWMASSPDRRAVVVDAVTGLDGFGWTVVAVIAIGGTLTLIALAAVIRRLQHRAMERAAPAVTPRS